MNRFFKFAILFIAASVTASAHPGHGHYGSTSAHSLAHLAIATCIGLIVIVAGLTVRHRSQQYSRVGIKK